MNKYLFMALVFLFTTISISATNYYPYLIHKEKSSLSELKIQLKTRAKFVYNMNTEKYVKYKFLEDDVGLDIVHDFYPKLTNQEIQYLILDDYKSSRFVVCFILGLIVFVFLLVIVVHLFS
jgi:hypothetical protein